MYKLIKEIDSRITPLLEEIEAAVLTCTRQQSVPNQNAATRRQTARTWEKRIKSLADDAAGFVYESSGLAMALCKATERSEPESCRKRLEKWQTEEEKPPKGGD